MRRLYIFATGERQVCITQIIGKDENDVGFCSGC